MAKQKEMEERIKHLETALREAKAGFELLHNHALKGFDDDAVIKCVHYKGVIDRALKELT